MFANYAGHPKHFFDIKIILVVLNSNYWVSRKAEGRNGTKRKRSLKKSYFMHRERKVNFSIFIR